MDETQQPELQPSAPKTMLWVGVVIIIIIGLGAGAYFMFIKDSTDANTANTTNAPATNTTSNQLPATNTTRTLTDEEKTEQGIPLEFTVEETTVDGVEVQTIYPPSSTGQ